MFLGWSQDFARRWVVVMAALGLGLLVAPELMSGLIALGYVGAALFLINREVGFGLVVATVVWLLFSFGWISFVVLGAALASAHNDVSFAGTVAWALSGPFVYLVAMVRAMRQRGSGMVDAGAPFLLLILAVVVGVAGFGSLWRENGLTAVDLKWVVVALFIGVPLTLSAVRGARSSSRPEGLESGAGSFVTVEPGPTWAVCSGCSSPFNNELRRCPSCGRET